LLTGIASLRPQLLLDQRRQLRRPAFGGVRDIEPLRQLHLRHQQEHHDGGRAYLAALPGPPSGTPEAAQLAGLAADRAPKPIHDQQRRPTPSRHKPEWPEAMLGERARADPLAVRALSGRVLGRDREEAPALAPDQRTLVKRADDLRRLGVDQARGVELPVRVVPVAPAVGEPLAQPGARHLAPELGLEAAAGLAGAGGDRAFDIAQLGLHVCLERAA
jgi:hypothetical protein